MTVAVENVAHAASILGYTCQLQCYKPYKTFMNESGCPDYLPDAKGMAQRGDTLTIHTALVSSEVSSIPAVHELKTWRAAPTENVIQALLQLRFLDDTDVARHVNDLLDSLFDLLSASDAELHAMGHGQAAASRSSSSGGGDTSGMAAILEPDAEGGDGDGSGNFATVAGTSAVAVMRRAGFALLVSLVDKLASTRAVAGGDGRSRRRSNAASGTGGGAAGSSFRAALDTYLRTRFSCTRLHTVRIGSALCVVVCQCGCMAVWLYGCVAVWLCGCMAM